MATAQQQAATKTETEGRATIPSFENVPGLSARDLEAMSYKDVIDTYAELHIGANFFSKQKELAREEILKRRKGSMQLRGNLFGINVSETPQNRLDTEAVKEKMGMGWYESMCRKVVSLTLKPFRL